MPNPPQQNVNLVMPIGLPPDGTDSVTHYGNLRTRLSAGVTASNVAEVWVADEDAYSGLYAMSKGFLRYLPVGASAPDGTTLAAPMLTLKSWLWDYLALRQNVSAGVTLPKLIGYANVRPDTVKAATHSELASNPRYQSLSAAERTQAEDDFMAGDLQLLVSPATMIGRGEVDTAGAHSGQRRLDLTFLDRDGTKLDPLFFFDLWGLVSGPQTRNHPLVGALARAVTPSQMPVEGGLRIRVRGTGFTAGTTVEVGGQPATEVTINADATTVYATSPPGAAGAADVIVTIPNQPAETHSGALTYTGELLATVRAAALAYAIALTEIREAAAALAAAGALDLDARQRLGIAKDSARNAVDDIIAARCDATGGTLFDPAVSDVWDGARDDLLALTTDIMASIA